MVFESARRTSLDTAFSETTVDIPVHSKILLNKKLHIVA